MLNNINNVFKLYNYSLYYVELRSTHQKVKHFGKCVKKLDFDAILAVLKKSRKVKNGVLKLSWLFYPCKVSHRLYWQRKRILKLAWKVDIEVQCLLHIFGEPRRGEVESIT